MISALVEPIAKWVKLADRNAFAENIQDVFMIISNVMEEIYEEIVVRPNSIEYYRYDEQMTRIKKKCVVWCIGQAETRSNIFLFCLPFESFGCVVLFSP